MQKTDWDDYRFILAVAERGTSQAAAKSLGVNHTTVLRRVSAFEKANNVKLFTRAPSGYRPTIEGEAVIALAGEIHEKLSGLRRDILGEALRLEGTLAVTTTDSLLTGVLAPHLERFCQRNPLIHLDLTVTSTRLNLTRRDADIGIRPARQAPQGLVARKVGKLAFAAYAAKDRVQTGAHRHAAPKWIGLGEALHGAPADEWLRANIPETEFAIKADTFSGVRDCIQAGIGIGVLPCCIGDVCPSLSRFGEIISECETSVWILNHRDLEGSARVAAFVEQIAEGMRADAAKLEGRL